MVEAARYALLRRLSVAIRHEMAAHLQPIGMMGELLSRRLRAASPDVGQVQDGVARLTALSRSAVQASLDVITWLAPEPEHRLRLDEAVHETVELLRSSFSFRGFVLNNTVGESPALVLRASLRLVLPACLLLLSDDAGPRAEITVSVRPGRGVKLRLALEPTDGPHPTSTPLSYRPLSRAEVGALAQAEGIGFAHEGDAIELRLPLLG
jgi:hypothetical protein